MKKLIISILTLTMVSCAVIETAFLVPRESVKIDLPKSSAQLSADEILDIAVNSSVKYFRDKNVKVTHRTATSVEIGAWREHSVVGYSAKAELIKQNKQLKISVKGANIYYADLPVINPVNQKLIHVKKPIKYTIKNIKKDIENSINQKK